VKRIEYKATFQHRDTGHVYETVIATYARDINTGFRKATALALKELGRWEICSVQFWQVTS
jgi:hypothetical protein